MTNHPHIAFFGSSLVSSYWNGAATYYRGILRALAARGYRITFYEPGAHDRQSRRDRFDPPWAEIVVYSGSDERDVARALERAAPADIVVKASGVGVFDDVLESGVLALRSPRTAVVYWDVDAPATLARVVHDLRDPFRAKIPRFDLVLTYGGGDPVIRSYRALGARACFPVYNALDPETHFPVPPDARFDADLTLLANRLPDRERGVDEFFVAPAAALPSRQLLLGGSGWEGKALPSNVRVVGHVPASDHNALDSSALAVLNVARESMAGTGFSPATRVFEAAGAAACVVTDAWNGIELFFEPGLEILVAKSGAEVADIVKSLTRTRARAIGEAARRRARAEHTYARRAEQVESLLGQGRRAPAAQHP